MNQVPEPPAEVPVSVPQTPNETPPPLLPRRGVDSLSYKQSPLPKCNCLPEGPFGFGSGPASVTDVSKTPDVTLTRKNRATKLSETALAAHKAGFEALVVHQGWSFFLPYKQSATLVF
ncbi:aquaporin NIP3-1-like isoform X2 [Spinacia oleracea]|uniref:Aquaporin NIP3-1-like isoform X2 n=1 Tax=Spinacia oleracea TaxID=3562 RepID=A0ABM3RLM9_SPIOL|nr:aquaporin NIP3-1-like isoform X2 [Spinacia oleracea]